MKKLVLPVLLLLSLTSPTGTHFLEAKTPMPSPYVVHDNEVLFWSLFHGIADKPGFYKLSIDMRSTQYVVSISEFVGVGLLKYSEGEFINPLRNGTEGKTYALSLFAGTSLIQESNGNPRYENLMFDRDYKSHPVCGAWVNLAGLELKAPFLTVRYGYLASGYAIPSSVYNPALRADVTRTDYFNYPVNNATMKFSSLDYNHRYYLDFQGRLGFVVPRLMYFAGYEIEEPSYVVTAVDFILLDNRYVVRPYYSHSFDAVGFHDFRTNQYGLRQIVFLQQNYATLDLDHSGPWRMYFTLDFNYTDMDRTVIARGKKIYYGRLQYNIGFIGLAYWYNNESHSGAGILFDVMTDFAGAWFSFNYNPYAPEPLYRRATAEESFSFEFGVRMWIGDK